jgi:hypothetical protein
MSIYTSLKINLPVISYSILHRPQNRSAVEAYEHTIQEMHAKVEEESMSVASNLRKELDETVERQSQMLRGALSQFLETPIRSDNAELQNIFRETFRKHRDQLTTGVPAGVIGSSEGVVRIGEARGSAFRVLAGNGRKYLRELGYPVTKTNAPVYESVYLVHGGENLDVLEHIVRDRLGIYSSPHGEHIKLVQTFVVAAHNLLHNAGTAYERAIHDAWGEAVLYFSKPDIRYEDFRTALVPAVEDLARQTSLPSVSIWQRKLGLGPGREFLIRCVVASERQVNSLVDAVQSLSSSPHLLDAIVKRGCLVVKELLYPEKAAKSDA